MWMDERMVDGRKDGGGATGEVPGGDAPAHAADGDPSPCGIHAQDAIHGGVGRAEPCRARRHSDGSSCRHDSPVASFPAPSQWRMGKRVTATAERDPARRDKAWAQLPSGVAHDLAAPPLRRVSCLASLYRGEDGDMDILDFLTRQVYVSGDFVSARRPAQGVRVVDGRARRWFTAAVASGRRPGKPASSRGCVGNGLTGTVTDEALLQTE
jgi:hypothetical protein